jgi:N-acetyl-anhydromuramyl-L-alanine amidase AmpD
MDLWHRQRGWDGVGYHYFIRKDGTIQEGRSLERTPAAQGGNNSWTIAICLHGLTKENFTSAQFSSLRSLCKEINTEYRAEGSGPETQSRITFHGHCEVSNKSCPVFDYKKVLNLDESGRIKTD